MRSTAAICVHDVVASFEGLLIFECLVEVCTGALYSPEDMWGEKF